jgi:hypothetical protein
MTGRALRCGSSDGRHCIELHWRTQARLVETEPGSGKWRGPCPKCRRAKALHVEVGDNGAPIWAVPECKDRHDREAVFPMLRARVACAPEPKHQANPELEALKKHMVAVLTNRTFTPTALRLAGLEACGIGTDEALDMLGITASSNRRRARRQRDTAMTRPASTIQADSKRRSKTPKSVTRTLPPRPAETSLPAATIQPDAPAAINSDSPTSTPKLLLTSTFADLTGRAKVVSGPAGRIRDTNTEALDLDLLTTALGAKVITEQPKRSPFSVADIAEMWTLAEAGPCVRCDATTILYGPRSTGPLCPECRTPAAVRRAGGAAPVTTSAVQ